jgi:uncharacterized protein (TIGR03545 family)
MRRWLHWQILVPRALFAAVALLSVQYVLGIAARSIAVRSGEAVLGVPVEAEHARVSVFSRQVVLSELRLADPQEPWKSIVQADRCELNFAAVPLLHKEVVVESGRISGFRFGSAARCDVGSSNKWFKEDADSAARKWLANLADQFTLAPVSQFDSVKQTEAFCAKWSRESAALDARLDELRIRARELQEEFDAAKANPLRNDKTMAELPAKALVLQKDFATFRGDVEKLPDVLEAERRAIVAARRHDGEVGGRVLNLDAPDANSLSAYLLHEHAAKQLDQLVGWLRWLREGWSVSTPALANTRRGDEILFAGCRKKPGFMIRSLQLDGYARFAGQPVELRGVLSDVSSSPNLHKEPMRLHLFGRGSMPLELQATIDRTGATPHEEFLLDCKGMLLPAMQLGDSGQLALQLAPSIGSLSISVAVDGDKLSGVVQMIQRRVQITPSFNNPGSSLLVTSTRESMEGISSVATRVSFGGTVSQPSCALWSNVGSAVAESLKQGIPRASDQHARTLLAEAGRRVDEKLAQLDRQVSDQQARFAAQGNKLSSRLQQIAAKETPRYRISEKGGRQLPSNSLFR